MKIQDAKRLLKNVKGEQFVSQERINERHYGFSQYKKIQDVLRSTEKALFIADFQHPEDNTTGYWIPKSKVLFNLKSNKDGNVDILLKFHDCYTNVYKENRELAKNDSNSIWCEIFAKQDANGLTINGYAL